VIPVQTNRASSVPTSTIGDNYYTAILISFVTIVCTSIALVYNPLIDYQINGDSFYLINITKDILFSGGSLTEWLIAPHYYLFPDVIIAAVAILISMIGLNIYFAILLVSLIATTAIVSFLWQRITTENFAASILAGTAIVAVSNVALRFTYSGQPQSSLPFNHLALAGQYLGPALHGGAILTAFGLFPAVSCAADTSEMVTRRFCCSAATMVVIALASFSDAAVLAWGVVPLSLTLIAQFRYGCKRDIGIILVGLSTASVPAYLLAASWNSVHADYVRASYVGLGQALQNLVRLAHGVLSLDQPLPLLFFLVNFALWIAGAIAFLREISGNSCRIDQLLIFASAMSLVSVFASVITGLLGDSVIRIFLPYVVLAPITAVFTFMFMLHRYFSRSIWFQVTIGLCLVVVASGVGSMAIANGPTASSIVGCLDRAGITKGAADFWDAGPIRAASEWRLDVAPLAPGTADGFAWLTRKDWVRDFSSGKLDRPAFLIATEKNRQSLANRFGVASEIRRCASREIWIYH
jgi:hypothetical protein